MNALVSLVYLAKFYISEFRVHIEILRVRQNLVAYVLKALIISMHLWCIHPNGSHDTILYSDRVYRISRTLRELIFPRLHGRQLWLDHAINLPQQTPL
jgi:hypothetical protein